MVAINIPGERTGQGPEDTRGSNDLTSGGHCLVESSPRTADEVVRGDERLLAEGALSVRVGRFSEDAVSVGVGERDVGELEQRSRARGLAWVRRASGGSALLHLKGDLFWSVVIPRSHPLAGRGFVRRYGELGAGWPSFLRERGVAAGWDAPLALNERYCLLSARGLVLQVAGRALGGASQHLRSGALLHHGIMSASLRPDLLHELFELPPSVVGRSLTSLEAEGVRIGPAELPELARRLAGALGEAS